MFNFFKQVKKSVSNSFQYPEVVVKIHNEFNTAGEKLLAEATEVIAKANSPVIDKAKRLSSLGFSQAQQVQESADIIKKAEISKETAELVQKYQVMYPNNKFITEDQVKEICFKYNLVCGDVKRFKGFVPEKNLKQIEDFKSRYDINKQLQVIHWSLGKVDVISMSDYSESKNNGYISYRHIKTGNHCFQQNINKHDGINFYGSYVDRNGKYHDDTSYRFEVIGLQICAPIKDMDMTGMTIEDGYKIKKIYIPDPVVLQPVKGGYIIVTAWGNEASDENVINQNHN